MPYDSTLPDDLNWVRALIQDTDSASPQLTDTEILAIISEQTATGKALKYFAAADALGILYTRWSGSGKGISNIRIGSLDIAQGVDSSVSSAVQERQKELRIRGARLLSNRRRLNVY